MRDSDPFRYCKRRRTLPTFLSTMSSRRFFSPVSERNVSSTFVDDIDHVVFGSEASPVHTAKYPLVHFLIGLSRYLRYLVIQRRHTLGPRPRERHMSLVFAAISRPRPTVAAKVAVSVPQGSAGGVVGQRDVSVAHDRFLDVDQTRVGA